jgi:hypothetical protein
VGYLQVVRHIRLLAKATGGEFEMTAARRRGATFAHLPSANNLSLERDSAMFKALKIASLGLGICCLTLSLSSVSRASQISVCDNDKYGKHDDGCKDVKYCDFGKLDCDLSKLFCDDKDLKGCKDDKYGKDDHKDFCKIDWGKHDDCFPICDDKDHGKCDIVPDCHHDCKPMPCDPDPHAVPAPAAAMTSGLGVITVALLGWLKNRRSVRA